MCTASFAEFLAESHSTLPYFHSLLLWLVLFEIGSKFKLETVVSRAEEVNFCHGRAHATEKVACVFGARCRREPIKRFELEDANV